LPVSPPRHPSPLRSASAVAAVPVTAGSGSRSVPSISSGVVRDHPRLHAPRGERRPTGEANRPRPTPRTRQNPKTEVPPTWGDDAGATWASTQHSGDRRASDYEPRQRRARRSTRRCRRVRETGSSSQRPGATRATLARPTPHTSRA
jgi:hypothetical protein